MCRYNKFLVIADIIIVASIIIVTVTAVILIFPLFVSVYVSAVKQEKRLSVSVTMFGITVFNINVKLFKNSLYIAKTFKKTYKIPLKSVLRPNSPLPKIKGVSVLSVYSVFDVGAPRSVETYVTAISVFSTVKNNIFAIIKCNKPYIGLNADLNVYEQSDAFNAYFKVCLICNVAVILFNLIKILCERIKYAIGKRQQNK